MPEIRSKVTTKGQVTIPAQIRRLLDVGPSDHVAFVVQGREVQLKKTSSVVERTAGMLKGREPVLSAKQLREAAEQAIAEEVMERTGG